MDDSIEAKLTAARAWLIIDRPFLGAGAAAAAHRGRPHVVPHYRHRRRSLYYNRDYIESLTFEQTKFVLAHEALHCALAHFARRVRAPPQAAFGTSPAISPSTRRWWPTAYNRRRAPLSWTASPTWRREEIYPYIQEKLGAGTARSTYLRR